MKKYLELFTSISQLIVGWSIAVGSIVILLYCMDIEFYPKGIEIGDGLFFIWTALAFGGRLIFTVLVFTAFGLTLYSAIAFLLNFVPRFNLPKVKTSTIWPIYVATLFFLVLLSLIAIINSPNKKDILENIDFMYWFTLAAALSMNGFIATALLTVNDKNSSDDVNGNINFEVPTESDLKRRKKILVVIFGFLLFFIPLLFIRGFGDKVLSLSISSLGIKKENVSLYLNSTSARYVSNLMSKGNYSFSLVPLGDGSYRLDEANVQFQGIGQITHILLKSESREVTFDLPSDSIVVANESEISRRSDLANLVKKDLEKLLKSHEIEFNPETYVFSFSEKYSSFQINSSNLSSSFKSVLNEVMPSILDFLNENQSLVEGVEIIGYSSREWKESESSVDAYIKNHELSLARSSSFLRQLYSSEPILSRMSQMIGLLNIKGVSSNLDSRKNKRTVELKIIPRVKDN